jgi:predicted alpha/beta-fold hydrolase
MVGHAALKPHPPDTAATMHDYRAPRWLPGGNLQTIWAALASRRHGAVAPAYQRERWDTPDGDFIDVDVAVPPPNRPSATPFKASLATPPGWLVLFHGLEGTSRSHYALAFADEAARRGLAFAVPHFRGCSGELNRAPRAYHSGDFEEIGWILQRLRARAGAPLWAVGVSLGGNALLRWAQEAGQSAAWTVRGIAAVSAPLDLTACGIAIGQGFNRQVYTRMFLRTMKPKALRKLAQHPGLFDRERLLAAQTLHDFDDTFTAPLHGFAGVQDYWRRASAKPHLHRIRVPAIVLNATNDPFVPGRSLPDAAQLGEAPVRLWQPPHGGHVGFPAGRFPGHVLDLPRAILDGLGIAARTG